MVYKNSLGKEKDTHKQKSKLDSVDYCASYCKLPSTQVPLPYDFIKENSSNVHSMNLVRHLT